MAKSKFYFDFYLNGHFIRRFNSLEKAKSLITWTNGLTYPKNLWKIKKVKKRKLSTGTNTNKTKGCKKCQE